MLFVTNTVFFEYLIFRARSQPINRYGLKPKKGEIGDNQMRTKKNLLAVAACLVCCIAAVLFSTSTQGGEKTYELRPEITLPEYRTDAARAIDAYERLMERYMDLMEMNLTRIGTDVEDLDKTLDSIDNKLTELCKRIARIEKALGIEQPKPTMKKIPQSKPAPEKAHKKSLQPGNG